MTFIGWFIDRISRNEYVKLKRTWDQDLRWKIYRGYYTVARRYEFYVRVARTISHE